MSEQRLAELLDTAARDYNDGKYPEAIAQWQEALAIDPQNQKAREGIRMAQLLVVNWEAPGEESAEPLSLETALPDEETREKVDIGIARVRELMGAGRYQEAIEGCELLAEIAPGMEAVSLLKEEVNQAHEAQPFIKDRIEKARKLLAQGKAKEAAEEAKKILTVDRSNKDALAIVAQAGGPSAAAEKPKPPSAFHVESAGKEPPPSPFSQHGAAGSVDMDALLAQFQFEESAPADKAAAPGARPAAVPSSGATEAPHTDTGKRAAAADPKAQAQLRAIVEEGEKLFVQRRYQEAIDTWSRVFGIDESNVEAGELIDRAKAAMEEVAREADEAYYRGVDSFERGQLEEARSCFEEVLSIQKDHADAKAYLKEIQVKMRPGAAAPAAAPAPQGAEAPPASAKASSPAALSGDSLPLDFSMSDARPAPARTSPVSSAGPVKAVKRVTPPPSTLPRTIVLSVLAVLVLAVGGGAYWFFFMMGQSTAAEDPGTPAATEVAPASTPGAGRTKAPGSKAAAPPAPEVAAGSPPSAAAPLEIRPGARKPEPEPATDPAAIQKKVESLLREGRVLMSEQSYTDAMAKFQEAVTLEPSNFDAVDLKAKAAQGAQVQSRYNKDMDTARKAFADADWAGALYKLYRLKEQKRDDAALALYIKNANYNWGIESLSGLEIEAAVEHFKDALEMAPGDPSIPKHIEVANRYKRRSRDAAFDAYVSSLKPKAIDER